MFMAARDHSHQALAAHDAFLRGDLDALQSLLGAPPEFPNSPMPADWGLGETCLGYAIGQSPLSCIQALLNAGADPNYEASDGFPSLIAALSSDRDDIEAILELLLKHGADVQQRGINDWTPLHWAVSQHDASLVRRLLAHGADPLAHTRVDDCTSPLEDAEARGYDDLVELLRAQPPR